ESGGHQYPNTAKAQMFINRLCPELYMAVSSLTPNMLEDAYARAKAFENTYRNNPTHMAFMAQPIGYSTYLPQGMVGTPGSPNTNLEIICFTCGRPGHISQQCPNSQNNNNNNPNPPVQQPPVNNTNNTNAQETLQALFALLNNPTPNGPQNNQPTYLGIHEEDEPLFLPAERHERKRPITNTVLLPKKKNVEGREDTVGLGKTEEIPPQDADMDNRNEIEDLDDDKKNVGLRWKVIEEELPQISSLVPPYSIVADIRDKPANITYGQLLRVSQNMRQELARSLQKKRTVTRKIHDKDIPLIVDSGSSGSVVTSHLLQELGIRIEHPSVVNMINIHGESKRAIGEISNFPFSVSGIEISIDVIVTDATSYCAIVGNDWLAKVNAAINWNSSDMTIYWDGKEITVPVEFRKMTRAPLEKERTVELIYALSEFDKGDDNTGYDDDRVRKGCHEKKHIGDKRMDQPGITCNVIHKEDQRIADLFDYCYENGTPAEEN
ncbi:8747_t:CDS:2, partial [Cetraspora pellucida]